MSLMEAIIEGATATVIGMGMVFGVLAILCVVLYFFKYLTPQEKPALKPSIPDEPAAETAEPEEVYDDSELLAVISAALTAYMGEGAVIKSISPAAASGKPGGSAYRAWNTAAIRENHRGLY